MVFYPLPDQLSVLLKLTTVTTAVESKWRSCSSLHQILGADFLEDQRDHVTKDEIQSLVTQIRNFRGNGKINNNNKKKKISF